jgi:hypothetical protein
MRRRHVGIGQGGDQIVDAVVMMAVDAQEGVAIAVARCH